jgi:hypothetical protein
MQRISILLFLLVFSFAGAVQAQAPAPKPDPELRKLSVQLGHWTYEGKYKPGPLVGPGGNFTGDFTGQMILGGFFFQGRWTEKGPTGEERGLEIDGYDSVNRDFASNWYMSDGSRFSGVLTFAGNTYTYVGKLIAAEKEYQFKVTYVLAPDLTTATEKGEISTDGKTWTLFGEEKWTKAQPAAKN